MNQNIHNLTIVKFLKKNTFARFFKISIYLKRLGLWHLSSKKSCFQRNGL